MSEVYTSQCNKLLGALPDEAFNRVSIHLEPVDMPLGQVFYESGEHLKYVYFPVTAVVSLLCTLKNGTSAEIAMVGNEGMLGVSMFMNGKTTMCRAVVQSAGTGYRLNTQFLNEEFSLNGSMMQLLLRYTHALITQMAQTAVCNRHHSLEQQLSRWLLLSLDRHESNELLMTQDLIANMLGVRRESITDAAGKLQRLGMIHHQRGHITVLDRAKLELHCCECYQVVKNEFDRLLN
jgi:CRP-like cAMP-binding protein